MITASIQLLLPAIYQVTSSARHLTSLLPPHVSEPPLTFDVVGLFANIDTGHLLKAYTFFATTMHSHQPNQFIRVNTHFSTPTASWKPSASYDQANRSHYNLYKSIKLLELLTSWSVANFQGQLYLQVRGIIQGAPASSLLADIMALYIFHIAHSRITALGLPIPHYTRYADDVLCWKHRDIFMAYIVPTFAEFGLELKRTTALDATSTPYLDVNVHTAPDGTLYTTHHSTAAVLFPTIPRLPSTLSSKTTHEHYAFVFNVTLRIYNATTFLRHFNSTIHTLRSHPSAQHYPTKLWARAIINVIRPQSSTHNRYFLKSISDIRRQTAPALATLP
jgi:hypothetical protein